MEEQTGTPKKAAKWAKAFLANLRVTGNVSAACFAAKTSRTVVYTMRRQDAEFAEQWQDALDQAADLLEEEAVRRAYHGVDKPVIHQGELRGTWVDATGQTVTQGTPGARLIPLTVKEYSDTLLIFLLKGARPAKFRDNVTVTGTGKQGEIVVHVLGGQASMSDL